jgi:cell division initiation protein
MSDRLTARDVEGQEFNRRVRGYDCDEVRMFLRSVSEEIERLNLANGELKEQVGGLEQRLSDFQTRERTLQETLITAQRMADELKEKTVTESELLVKEARIKAERLLQQAQDQLARIEAEISRTRLERDMFENRLRSLIEEHQSMIDLRKTERTDQEPNVTYLRRRASSDA